MKNEIVSGAARDDEQREKSNSFLLSVLILVAMVLGLIAGQMVFARYSGSADPADAEALARFIDVFDFVGSTCFMGLLKMVLIPLVASSVIVGVSRLSITVMRGTPHLKRMKS